MVKLLTTKLIAAPALFYWSGGVLAHENHGLSGPHWHATDAWGFVALAAMVAVAIWLTRGDE
jgi:hypothetical protein